MKTSKLHTLEDILSKGITLDDGTIIPVSSVFIPKIQRSYAQGRISETDVRNDFLNDIFATLTSEKDTSLELSFLFGSKQQTINGGDDGFELLDGQQRTTTLYLLYWYVYNRESAEMPSFFRHFTYETRDTSTQFLSKISCAKMKLSDSNPSTVIKSNKWFTDDFFCDVTICAMLNTLDDIHFRYNMAEQDNLISKLSRLKVYVLLLEKFDRNDELYIKMNSRGLSLIPFENFKASLVKYMKAPARMGVYGTDDPKDGEMPYWLSFTSELDAKWIDIFWENPNKNLPKGDSAGLVVINDKEIGSSYFRFFNRYFFTKAALLKGVSNKKMTDLPSFFYKDAESDDAESRLKGWNYYEELFDLMTSDHLLKKESGFPVFSKIERVLDIFHSCYPLICSKIMNDPYGNTTSFDVRVKDGFLWSHRVIFAATTEFIEAMPQGRDFNDSAIIKNYERMLRVVHNIIENTLLETAVATIGVIAAISEIIHFPGATDGNFYESLATNKLTSHNRQLLEEKEKAQEMFMNGAYDQSWEKSFINAESHPFFKGSVAFFFTPGAGRSADFEARYNTVKDLFDSNGISYSYRKDHILIRAILSCLNHWNSSSSPSVHSGMGWRYFTENVEKEKFLKNMIVGCPEVRQLFCDYFKTNVSFDTYLKDVIDNAQPAADENDESFKMMYSRIITDSHASNIFDWIALRESDKKACFRFQSNRGYNIAIPGKWFDQIVLDTERHLIVPDFISRLGFDFVNDDKKKCFGRFGDAWGWQIGIEKAVIGQSGKGFELRVIFDEWKNAIIYVSGQDITELMNLFQLAPDAVEGVRVKVSVVHYQFYNDRQSIEDAIVRIEKQLAQL